MHGCVKRRFATHQNASKILFGGAFKIMLVTMQTCCIWADSNSLIKRRHLYYGVYRRATANLLKQESCALAQ